MEVTKKEKEGQLTSGILFIFPDKSPVNISDYDVTIEQILQSYTIRNIYEEKTEGFVVEDRDGREAVPSIVEMDLPQVNYDQFLEVLRFINYYCDKPYEEIPKPLPTSDLSDIIKDHFYIDFIGENFEEILSMFDVAVYLDYKPMISLYAAKIASCMKNRKVEDIRYLFGIKPDFDASEQEEIKKIIAEIDDICISDQCL